LREARTRTVFFPYLYGGESLRLSLQGCLLDGRPFDPSWDDDLLECDLSAAPSWTEASIRFRVERDAGGMWIPELIPPVERASPPVSLVAVVHCGPTLRRSHFTGTLDLSSGSGEVEIRLRGEDLRGHVELSVYVTRARAQASDPAFAADAAARIIASRMATIRIEPALRLPGTGLEIEWESFGSSKHLYRSQHASALFHLDTSKSPPVLYLNKDADPDLYAVMSDAAPRGRKALLRNLLFAAIAIPVWQALLVSALKAADSEGNVDAGWERDVLREVAEAAEPDCEPSEALTRLVRDLRDTSGGRGIEERLPVILSEMVQFRLRAEQSLGAIL
jgi:hypothetical protein